MSMGGNIWTERFTMAFRIVTFIVITAIISGCRYANTRVENDAPGPCKAIYADADYISYRTSEWLDNEDAVHGIDHVEVWTVSKRTGKRLKAEDIIPASRRTQVLDGMQKAITVKLDGNLLCPVFLTDNCCIAADGVHFVFNEYVIAPFLEGVVEAVVGQDGKISVSQYGNTPKFAE